MNNGQTSIYNFGFENIRLCAPCHTEWQRVKLRHFKDWLGGVDLKPKKRRGLSAARMAEAGLLDPEAQERYDKARA